MSKTLFLNFGVFFLLNYNMILSPMLEDTSDYENIIIYLQVSTFVAWCFSLSVFVIEIYIPLIKGRIRESRL